MPRRQIVLQGNSLDLMGDYVDGFFTAACFSPPYGIGSEGFDIRRDFRLDGAFMPFASELSRVCKLWAINFTQRVFQGHNLPWIEEFVMELESEGTYLWDRWVCYKPDSRPKRGPRVRANYEFLYLFTAEPDRIVRAGGDVVPWTTAFPVKTPRASSAARDLGLRPYYIEMPRRVFEVYGGRGPVLDPFVGSGTSLFAARELHLPAVGMELDEAVWALARQNLGY